MKKIKKQKTFLKEYYPVILWMEDLEEIVDLLKNEGAAVEISSEDYEFASLQDAAHHFGQRPQYDFRLSCDKPYARVEFGRMTTSVYVGPDPASARMFQEIDEILRRAQRKPPFLYSLWLWVPSVTSNFVTFIPMPKTYSTAVLIASSLLLAWYLRAIFIRTSRNSVIRFQRRADAKPFLERNKDQLLMMVISAIIGGLITFAGTKLKDYVFVSSTSAKSD